MKNLNRGKVIALTKDALSELDNTITSNYNKYPHSHLVKFKHYLEEMLKELNFTQLPSKSFRNKGMGHVIVDSWPLNSVLGDKIISAENAYLDLPDS